MEIKHFEMEDIIRKGMSNKEVMDRFHSFKIMEPTLVECVSEENVVISFPVVEWQLNGFNSMQGGFIAAAFDNVFGLLCYSSINQETFTTLDMNLSYHRPIFLGDILKISVNIKYIGRSIICMTDEAFNGENKLIASAMTNTMRLNK